MSPSSRLQAINARAEAHADLDQPAHQPFETADRPFQFETIPTVCLITDVCRILKLSPRQFRYLMARRALALVELPAWDRKRRFSGESVARVARMRKVS